jgi:hypothetical protein
MLATRCIAWLWQGHPGPIADRPVLWEQFRDRQGDELRAIEDNMMSRRRAEANRQNALRSTGPRTPEGRAASSRNAVRHGVLSNTFVAEHENHDAFQRLLEGLVADFEPETAMESLLIERLAMLFWRERRLAVAEAEQTDLHFSQSGGPFGGGGPRNVPIANQYLVGRYQGMLGRHIRDTLRDFRDAQEKRLQQIDLPNFDSINDEEIDF